MIEARIICCEPVDLTDLNLTLQRGQEVWVSNDIAHRSRDLQRAVAMGKVRVTRMERQVANKPPPPPRVLPPFVTRPRPILRGEDSKSEAAKTPEVVSQPDFEERLRESEERLRDNLRETIAEEIAKALAAHASNQNTNNNTPQASMDATTIASVMEEVLKKNLPNASSGGVVIPSSKKRDQSRPSTTEEPLYMPSNLVDKNAKSKISVSSKTSGKTDDVDDATAALRALKKNKSKRGNNENEEK